MAKTSDSKQELTTMREYACHPDWDGQRDTRRNSSMRSEAPPMGDLTADTRPVEAKGTRPEVLKPGRADEAGADHQTILLERERRRYVKASGGFRKNLCRADLKRGQELCDTLKMPPEKGWMNIHIGEADLGPGRVYDNIDRSAKRGREWNDKESKSRT
jgi:hypothetical protein